MTDSMSFPLMVNMLKMFFHCRFIKTFSFTFNYTYRILRTITKAGAKTVAKVFGRKNRLTVFDPDCPFSTRRDAKPATITLLFVNLYNFSDHFFTSLEKVVPEIVQSPPHYQLTPGKRHYFANLCTIFTVVAVNMTLPTGRFRVNRAVSALLDPVQKQFAALIAENNLLWEKCGNFTRKSRIRFGFVAVPVFTVTLNKIT
jgi:hypothetical protein